MTTSLLPAGIAASVISGGYQTYIDYNNAEPKNKNKVLLKNSIILASTGIGTITGKKIGDKFIKKINPNIGLILGGIVSGIIAGQFLEKFLPINTNTKNGDTEKKSNINNIANAYSRASMDIANKMEAPLAPLSGYNVAKEQGLKNKIRKAAYEIIANFIVPTLMIMPFSAILKEADANKKAMILTPLIGSSMFIGNAVAKWFNDKITEKIMQKEMWSKVSQKQQDLIKSSFDFIQNKNNAAQQKILKDLQNLRMAKEKIKFSK